MDQLDKLNEKMEEKRLDSKKKNNFFHQGNAPAQSTFKQKPN